MKFASVVRAALLFALPGVQVFGQQALVAKQRQQIESTDSRATGRLVQVDAGGKRSTQAISVKAHWFPGVLRVLVEIRPAKSPNAGTGQDARVSVLLEMRPEGQDTVRLFQPRTSVPTTLPSARWGEGIAGTDFTYEDLLQPQLFWHTQTLSKTATLGSHLCDVLKSTPDAADHSQYTEVQTWIDQATSYPLYVEKTLRSGSAIKTFTSLGLTQTGGVWAARQVEAKVQGRAGSSLLIFERGSTKAHLGPKDFSPEQIARFEKSPDQLNQPEQPD